MKSRIKLVLSSLILTFSLIFAVNVGYSAISSSSILDLGHCKDCGSTHNCNIGNEDQICGYKYCSLSPSGCDATDYGPCDGSQPCIE